MLEMKIVVYRSLFYRISGADFTKGKGKNNESIFSPVL